MFSSPFQVTFAYNASFGHQDAQEKFPKEDVRVYVTTMNEGSPRYTVLYKHQTLQAPRASDSKKH